MSVPSKAVAKFRAGQNSDAQRQAAERRPDENAKHLRAVAVVDAVADGDQIGPEACVDERGVAPDIGEPQGQDEAGDGARRQRPAEPARVEAHQVLGEQAKPQPPAGRRGFGCAFRNPGRRPHGVLRTRWGTVFSRDERRSPEPSRSGGRVRAAARAMARLR